MNAALDQVRDPAGELDHLLAAGHLAERVGEHLAVLGGDDRGQLVLAGVQQLPEREQDLGPPGQRGVPPLRERLGRRRDDLVDVAPRWPAPAAPITSPVAGLVTSQKRPPEPS